jgi:hypothetical protein
MSGHETESEVNFEMQTHPLAEETSPIDIYRSFVVPSLMHHLESHKPDIIKFNSNIPNVIS